MREIEIPSMVFCCMGLTVSLDDLHSGLCGFLQGLGLTVFALVFRLMSAQTAYLWVFILWCCVEC